MEKDSIPNDENSDLGEDSFYNDHNVEHNRHSYFLDRTQSDSDDDESYKSCDNASNNDANETIQNEVVVLESSPTDRLQNFPPETVENSDDESLSSAVSHRNDDTEIDDSENDSNISDPANDNDDFYDENIPRTTFQRELLQYLGSLFSTSSRFRSREVRSNLEITDEQLEEYIHLRNKVDNELRVIGVNKFQNSSSNSDNITRNLVGLLISRERGDWDSSRRASSCLLRYEKVSNNEPMHKCRKIEINNEDMSIDEKIEHEEEKFGKWDIETNLSDDEDIKPEPQNNLPQDKQVISINLSNNRRSDSTTVQYSNLYSEESKWENIGEMRANLGNLWRGVYGSRWSTGRLSLEARINVHDGCINALHFNNTGNWLASGSDDRKIVITDWQKNRQVARFSVGHSSNIFQVKFLQQPSLSLSNQWNINNGFQNDIQMVSCSRDRTVRYAVLSSCGTLEYTRLLTRHQDCCHKTDVPFDTPYIVLSAGEDQRVVSSDIRCQPKSPDSGVGVKLCSVKKVPLYSIACSPVRSQEFAVAGKSPNVFIFDRRNPAKPLHTLCPPHMNPSKTNLSGTGSSSGNNFHVTSVCYSKDGTGVLSSYNDENIYLMSSQPGIYVMDQYSETPSQYMRKDNGPVIHCYKGHRNMKTVTGVSFYGPRHEFVISGSNDGHVLLWDRETEAIVNWIRADELGVVNVLESHPYCPVLATAGLDSDIKLWSGVAADIRREDRDENENDNKCFRSIFNSILTPPDYRNTGLPLTTTTTNNSPNSTTNSSPLSECDDDEIRYEAARIELAWQKALERASKETKMENSTSISSDNKKSVKNKRPITWEDKSKLETCMKLPFKLEHLKLIAGVNWKLREEYLPFEMDSDDFVIMHRQHSSGNDDEDEIEVDAVSDGDSDDETSNINAMHTEATPETEPANNNNVSNLTTNTDDDETASREQRLRNAARIIDRNRSGTLNRQESCRPS